MNKISCIIPAYNEESRIKTVLDVVVLHPLIHEVIVVDDASKDNTRGVIETFSSIRKIFQPINRGKSFAISTGIKASTGDFLFFLDADLTNLTAQNVSDLITPVVNNQADVSISLRNYKFWKMVGLDPLSGERVLPKKLLLEKCEEIEALPPFGLEVFFNRIIIKNHLKVKIVLWKNVMSPLKSQKYGMLAGIKGDISMLKDIFRVISPVEAILQVTRMLKQKIK